MLIIAIGLACLYLSVRAIHYSRKSDTAKLKKYIGTKNLKIGFILGLIGLVTGTIILLLGTASISTR